MSTKEAVKPLQEYRNVPLTGLVESSTNPRKAFDEEKLEELAESIRGKGILSPLLTRRVNGHFEIVSGARRYRAAQRAGLREVPVRIVSLRSGPSSPLGRNRNQWFSACNLRNSRQRMYWAALA